MTRDRESRVRRSRWIIRIATAVMAGVVVILAIGVMRMGHDGTVTLRNAHPLAPKSVVIPTLPPNPN